MTGARRQIEGPLRAVMLFHGKRLEELSDADLDAFKAEVIVGAEKVTLHLALMEAAYDEWIAETARRRQTLQ